MTKTLTEHWKIGIAILLVAGLSLALTLGISLTSSDSDHALAQEIVSNSSEVQDALGSEEVKVIGMEIRGGKALVICTDITGNSYVVVELDLKDKDVTRVTYPAVGEPYLPNPQMESEILQTTTDKLSYESGEEVMIRIINISPETITGGGVFFAVYDLAGNLLAGNGIFLAFEWDSNEGFSSFIWNQMDDQGEQVAPGTYAILGTAGDYSDAVLISIN